MIYGYISDTALAPLVGPNGISSNTDYNTFMTQGVGVGQLTERVMSMFNTDVPLTDTSTVLSPGLIIDPRTISGNSRRLGLFTGDPTYVANTSTIRAAGAMSIHYDQYLAVEDARNSPDTNAGNLIQDVDNVVELTRLFDMIETILYTHSYDSLNEVWIYNSQNALDSLLSNKYGEATTGYGYVAGTLVMPELSYASDKTANMRNISTSSNTVVNTVGTGESKDKRILFPDYIRFSFKFIALDSATAFTLYFNPAALINGYTRSTITHVVLPLSPQDLFTLTDTTGTSFSTVGDVSQYVGDMISSKIYKTDVLKGTNYTGAKTIQTGYGDNNHTINFTCVFRGRTPTTTEAKYAVYTILFNYLIDNGRTKDEAKEEIDATFPGLISTESYTIIPFYNTRVDSDISNTYNYSKNVFSLAYLERILNAYQDHATNANAYTTLITVPGYFMHAIAISEHSTASAETPELISKYGLDASTMFASYQAIDTQDIRWATMTDEAQKLNQYLSSIVGSELNGITPPVNFTYENRTVAGVPCVFYAFSVGSATFAVMSRGSYDSFINGGLG